MSCTEKAIRAHSVQNSRILSWLERDGHVIGLTPSVSLNQPPKLEFKTIGRNQATTFTGLCAAHDQSLFSAFEKSGVDLDNEEHLFLLAMRAVYRELHATMAGVVKIQGAYKERVRRGLDPGDRPSPAGMMAVERMIVSWTTFIYKSHLDEAQSKRRFGALVHDVIKLAVDKPTIAVCSLFSVDDVLLKDDILRVHLNILPLDEKTTVAVFSYRSADASLARKSLANILQASGAKQRHELSRLVLSKCENFVLAPQYFDTWSQSKREIVVDYFTRTMRKDDPAFDSDELDLL